MQIIQDTVAPNCTDKQHIHFHSLINAEHSMWIHCRIFSRIEQPPSCLPCRSIRQSDALPPAPRPGPDGWQRPTSSAAPLTRGVRVCPSAPPSCRLRTPSAFGLGSVRWACVRFLTPSSEVDFSLVIGLKWMVLCNVLCGMSHGLEFESVLSHSCFIACCPV